MKQSELSPSAAFRSLCNEVKFRSKPAPDPHLTALPLDDIHIEDAIFQQREYPSEYHVGILVGALKAQSGYPLDPILVWFSGEHWYVVDGHHRLEAYRTYNAETPKHPITKIPVTVFSGSLTQAISRSAAENSKDKEPMRKEDKLNAAWRLVCLDDKEVTGKSLAQAAGVALRTVRNMQAVFKTLCEDTHPINLLDLTWREARMRSKGETHLEPWDEDRNEQQGIEWAKRLKKDFGPAFATNPEAAAYAILHYSRDLPRRLIETPAFEKAVTDLKSASEDSSDLPDYY
nr:ParB N-terminal domain-containing protein [uncultured Cohaesibacter sp.]